MMDENILFPFINYWWFYLVFVVFILLILAIDLGVFHKKAHVVSFKEAAIWTGTWILLALIFNLLFYFYCLWKFSQPEYISLSGFYPSIQAQISALEFLTGYIVEKSLAIDNIFIFSIVFSYFSVPKKYQHRVLFWGILGAIMFRSIFIAMGALLMQYQFIILFFGILLILTGAKILFIGVEQPDLSQNIIIKLMNKLFRISPRIEDQRFFLVKKGLLYVSPLFIALIFIELSDIIFAIDSVPAIFALTKEPFIVFTSNIFAILGLRSMYFMLVSGLDRFIYIKYGMAAILIFVGAKMVYLNKAFGGKFPITWSLSIILILLAVPIFFSLIKQRDR